MHDRFLQINLTQQDQEQQILSLETLLSDKTKNEIKRIIFNIKALNLTRLHMKQQTLEKNSQMIRLNIYFLRKQQQKVFCSVAKLYYKTKQKGICSSCLQQGLLSFRQLYSNQKLIHLEIFSLFVVEVGIVIV